MLDTRFSTWSVEIQNPVRADFQPLISDTQLKTLERCSLLMGIVGVMGYEV